MVPGRVQAADDRWDGRTAIARTSQVIAEGRQVIRDSPLRRQLGVVCLGEVVSERCYGHQEDANVVCCMLCVMCDV